MTWFVVVPTGGCIQASLATRTGPHGPEAWSPEPKQEAHVGETVQYSFLLVDPVRDRPIPPLDYADYCLATIGGERVLCEPDREGRFVFEHKLTGAEPGTTVKMVATAYRQYATRDYLQLGSQWMRGDSPYDEPDGKLQSDSISLRVYQSRIELLVPPGPAYNFDSGRLEVVRWDGQVRVLQRYRPDRPGFEVQEQGGQGGYRVVFQPEGADVNPSGETEVRFTVFDDAGLPYRFDAEIPTP